MTSLLPAGTSRRVRLTAFGGGWDVHYLDFGGPTEGNPTAVQPDGAASTDTTCTPPIVLVHGLGGSALNWLRIAPALAARTRVYAVDLAGFGLSQPRGRSGSVASNTAVLNAFIHEVAGGRVVLVGNSMGGLVSMRQASQHPQTVAGLVLLDPVLPRPRGTKLDRDVALVFALYLTPGVGPRFLANRRARRTPRAAVLETLALCAVDPTAIPEEFVAPAVEQAQLRALAGEGVTPRQLDVAFLQAARSLVRLSARRRDYLDMMRTITAPVVLLHGDKDRLVPVESARAVAAALPAWSYHECPDVGHIPMVEVPDDVIARVEELLVRVSVTAS